MVKKAGRRPGMKNAFKSLFPVVFLSAVLAAGAQPAEMPRVDLSDCLTLYPVETGVWLVVHVFPWPANSLLVRTGPEDMMLVDTPWEEEGTRLLLEWVRREFGEIRLTAVNTHYHLDNLGGNAVLVERGIPVWGSEMTARLFAEKAAANVQRTIAMLRGSGREKFAEAFGRVRLRPPDHLFSETAGLELRSGDGMAVLFYPGPAHTLDNIVVYFPSRRLLFGGCMIRSMDSEALGSHPEGDTSAWPASALRVLERFPELRIVVPGHGFWGGAELIRHTVELARKR